MTKSFVRVVLFIVAVVFSATSIVTAQAIVTAQEAWVLWESSSKSTIVIETGVQTGDLHVYKPVRGLPSYQACEAEVEGFPELRKAFLLELLGKHATSEDFLEIIEIEGKRKVQVTVSPSYFPKATVYEQQHIFQVCFPASIDPRGTQANQTAENQPAGEPLPPSTSQSLPGMSPDLMRQLLLLQLLGR